MSVLDWEHRCGLKKRLKRSGIVAVAATSVESELYSMRPFTWSGAGLGVGVGSGSGSGSG